MHTVNYLASTRGHGYVEYIGTTWESAQALVESEYEDPRDRLFAPANFLCNVLGEKVAIAEHMGVRRSELVRMAADVALGHVQGRAVSKQHPLIEATRRFDGRLQRRVFDEVSIKALTNIRAQMVREVATIVSGGGKEALIFMPMANGAIPSALLIADQVASVTPTLLYPVRFSANKLHQTVPAITCEEDEYLATLAADHHFLIFDEDVHSGRTMGGMMRHLVHEVVSEDRVHGFTVFQSGATESEEHALYAAGIDGCYQRSFPKKS